MGGGYPPYPPPLYPPLPREHSLSVLLYILFKRYQRVFGGKSLCFTNYIIIIIYSSKSPLGTSSPWGQGLVLCSLAELFNFIGLVERQEYIYSNL